MLRRWQYGGKKEIIFGLTLVITEENFELLKFSRIFACK
jgi:hypothetical protein